MILKVRNETWKNLLLGRSQLDFRYLGKPMQSPKFFVASVNQAASYSWGKKVAPRNKKTSGD